MERYRLHGTKSLLKEMAARSNGHQIEVTGAVTDTGNTTHRGKTIPVGKNWPNLYRGEGSPRETDRKRRPDPGRRLVS